MTFLPDLNVLLAYTAAAVILVITPGPDMTLFLGQTLRSGTTDWNVVGHFRDRGSIAESEIWTDAPVLQGVYKRGTSFQSVRARLTSAQAFQAFKDGLTTDPRLNVRVLRRITGLPNDPPQLRQRNRVARLEANVGARLLEGDVHGVNPVELSDGHAHGVGTERSIHAEDVQLHAAQFGRRERRKQDDERQRRGSSSHQVHDQCPFPLEGQNKYVKLRPKRNRSSGCSGRLR